MLVRPFPGVVPIYELVKHTLMTLLLVATAPLVAFSAVVHRKRRRKSLRAFVLFFVGVFIYLFRIWVESAGPFFLQAAPSASVMLAGRVLGAVGAFGILVFGAPFIHRILEIASPRWASALYVALCGILAALSPFPATRAADILVPAAMIVIFTYCLLRMLAAWKDLGDSALKNAARGTLFLFALCAPCSVLLILHLSETADRLALLVMLSGIIVQFVLSLILWHRYFDREPYSDGRSLTPLFVERFGITPREKDIVERILGGLDNKSIAYALSIAPKTVANLLSNVFHKTKTQSRTQLVSLIHGTMV